MKEKLLKAIVLVMAAITVFSMTTMMFSAAEIGDNVPTTKAPTTAAPTTAAPTTAAPTTAKPADPTTAKPADPTTAKPADPTTAKPADPTTAAPTTEKPEFEYTTLVRPDRPTQATTKAPAGTTKKPAGTTRKPASTTRRPSNNVPVVATTLPEELSSEEFTTEYLLDETTTQYIWTFAEDTTEAEKEESGVNVKKIIIIAVIVVAVVGAGVCLIILGKKQ